MNTYTETSAVPASSGFSLGPVTVVVADLERSLTYYQGAIGLSVLSREPGQATLGVGSEPLLEVREEPGATPARAEHTGLYHMAILLPGRADLGRFVAHLIEARVPVQGASDHRVSEALYLQDPDGHGIEVYADRDPAVWAWQDGQVQMDTKAADIEAIVGAAGPDLAWKGLPVGTVMGHVHLKVSDVASTRAFYAGLLGLDVVADLSRQGALFMSKDGYHHHFGLNVWQSRGGRAAQSGEARLLSAEVRLPADGLQALRSRLLEAGTEVEGQGDAFTVTDPSGTLLRFGVRQ